MASTCMSLTVMTRNPDLTWGVYLFSPWQLAKGTEYTRKRTQFLYSSVSFITAELDTACDKEGVTGRGVENLDETCVKVDLMNGSKKLSEIDG